MLNPTPNATVDIYRGVTLAAPYPFQMQQPAVSGVRGVLKHHLQNGRFGYNAANLHWTHLLLVEPETDIRSAYNSQLGTFTAANADTVVLKDCPQGSGNCCAFMALMVQRARRGQADEHLRVYLDRFQPRLGSCYQKNCDQCKIAPYAWTLTLGNDFTNLGCINCARLNSGSYILSSTGGNCFWQSPTFPGPCATSAQWTLSYNGAGFWTLILNAVPSGSALLQYSAIATASWKCNDINTFTGPIWSGGTCASSSAAIVTPVPGPS
jgi:hypothetical protein